MLDKIRCEGQKALLTVLQLILALTKSKSAGSQKGDVRACGLDKGSAGRGGGGRSATVPA